MSYSNRKCNNSTITRLVEEHYEDEVCYLAMEPNHLAIELGELIGAVFISGMSTGEMSIREAIDSNEPRVTTLIREVVSILDNTIDPNVLVRHFSFPPEIRVSCEQYLLYFTQFLGDVGIRAIADIHQLPGEAGDVLFKVTPEGGEDALSKVREALSIYLGLAETKPQSGISGEIAVLRLESQILNFQSQLKLAQAEIQMKDATIEAKNEAIAALRFGQVFASAAASPIENAEVEESFNIVGPYIRAKKFEWKGIEVDLSAALHAVKRLLVMEDPKPEINAPAPPPALPAPDDQAK